MGFKCNGSIQAVRLRISKLDASGTPTLGAGNQVVSDALIKLGWKYLINAGTKIDQENGSGNVCLTYQGDDTIDGVQLDLDLCILDDDLICLATGATPVTIGGVVRGNAIPAVGVPLSSRVCIEAWSLAWATDAQAVNGSTPLYHHWVWPSVGCRVDDSSIANAAYSQPITGRGRGNPNIYNGPNNDLPANVFTSAMGRFVDTAALPAATCGLITVAS